MSGLSDRPRVSPVYGPRSTYRLVLVGDSTGANAAAAYLTQLGMSAARFSTVRESLENDSAGRGGRIVIVALSGREQHLVDDVAQFRSFDVQSHLVLLGTATRYPPTLSRAARREGIDAEIIVHSEYEFAPLVAAVLLRRPYLLPREVFEPIGPFANRLLQSVITWCIRGSFSRIRVSEWADWFAIDRKTLYRTLRRHCDAVPERVLTLSRLVHVANVLDRGSTSIAQISTRLGLGTSSSLHKLVKRTLGVTPGYLRQRGALGVVSALLATNLGPRRDEGGSVLRSSAVG